MSTELLGKCYSFVVPHSVKKSMVENPSFAAIRKDIVTNFIEHNQIDTTEVQRTLDVCGISRTGYTEVFRAKNEKLKQEKMKVNLLPKPFHVRQERVDLNL